MFIKNMLILLVISGFTACGTQTRNQTNKLDTVEIPQTPIRDQMFVGFCWAYTTVALIESNYKTQTGKTAQLSPEAIGFYRMAAGLYEATRAKSITDLLPLLQPGGLEGYFVKLPNEGDDALSLISTYGVVPESVWSYKFETPQQSEQVMRTMQNKLWVLLRDRLLQGKDATDLTVEDIIEKVMIAPGAFPTRPPLNFTIDGQDVSSISYLRDTLGFVPESFTAMQVKSDEEYKNMIQATKRALVRGISVPLAFPVNMKLLNKDTFSGAGSDDSTDFAASGAHAVLITDFVNVGKNPGGLAKSEIQEELHKSPEELDYVIVKNSWGTDVKSNEGKEIGSPTGFFKIDKKYLDGSSKQSIKDPAIRNVFSVMVPRDIAEAPFAAEP